MNMFSGYQNQDFVLLPDTNEVQVGKNVIKLTPKEFGVLELLNTQTGSTVTRTELLETVWGNKYANDQGLTQAISKLRVVLSPCTGVFIRTIPKKGYQLKREVVVRKESIPRKRKPNLMVAILLVITIAVCILIYMQPIRIRVQKTQIKSPENTQSSAVRN